MSCWVTHKNTAVFTNRFNAVVQWEFAHFTVAMLAIGGVYNKILRETVCKGPATPCDEIGQLAAILGF